MSLRSPQVYIYVVDRDFGFAPNPFHKVCTLACCKPKIRSSAQVGAWVFGIGGKRLQATGQCVFGMQVTTTMTFDEYWMDPRYQVKRPVRNGSRVMMLGDNIYHRKTLESDWIQENSHHSCTDGSPNPSNIMKDTRTNRVLASTHFLYFGAEAPKIPSNILGEMGYKNCQGHRTFSISKAKGLLDWFDGISRGKIGWVLGDPFQFQSSAARYSAGSNEISS